MVKTWKPERLEASWVPCSLPCMLKLRSKQTETILRKASVSRSQVLWSPTARMRWTGRKQPKSWRCTGRSTGSCQQAVWADGLIMGIKVREMVINQYDPGSQSWWNMGINKRNVLCNSSASCFLGFNLWVTGIRMQLQKEPETLADCKAERDVSFGWSALFWNQKKTKK